MPVTKVAQISARKCTKSVWRPLVERTAFPPDLAGFNSGGRDKGRRTGKDRRGWTAEGGGQRKEWRCGRGGRMEERERRREEKSRPHGHF